MAINSIKKLTIFLLLSNQICLHKDESSFVDCSEILDRHSNCLKSQSGDVLNASVTASEPSYDSRKQNGLRQFVILLCQAVHHVFGEVCCSYYSIARATAIDYDVVALERHLNLRISTACSFKWFFALLCILCVFVGLLHLALRQLFNYDILGFLQFCTDLVLASKLLELVIFLKQFLVQFSRSLKLLFGGWLTDNLLPCVFSFLELLLCLS